MIMRLIFYIFCAYGLSEMMVFSNGPFGMFSGIRSVASRISSGLGELFSCMICLPTWVGITFSAINVIFMPIVPFTPANIILGVGGGFWMVLFKIILDGLFTSGTTWILYQIESYVENTTPKTDSDE